MERNTKQNTGKNIGIFLGGLVLGVIVGLAIYRFFLVEPQQFSFYAHIVSIDSESSILISGIEENEVNFRGDMYIKTDNRTEFIIARERANFNDFQEGDLVRVTLPRNTMILESYPSQVVEPAIRIERIDE